MIADVAATGSWEGAGILSPAHWVAGVRGVAGADPAPGVDGHAPGRAARHPGSFEAGALSEDQVALICRHAPANADDPDGLVFTDKRGRRLMGCGRPAPPGDMVVTGNWTPPSGERLDPWCVYFHEVPTAS